MGYYSRTDLIRAMTDEELVDAIGLSCQRCAYYYSRKDYDKKNLCREGNLEWLKQEVSEDD